MSHVTPFFYGLFVGPAFLLIPLVWRTLKLCWFYRRLATDYGAAAVRTQILHYLIGTLFISGCILTLVWLLPEPANAWYDTITTIIGLLLGGVIWMFGAIALDLDLPKVTTDTI